MNITNDTYSGLDIAPADKASSLIHILLGGLYLLVSGLLGREHRRSGVYVSTIQAVSGSRAYRLQEARDARLCKNNYRNPQHLRLFLPRGLTGNQFNERSIRLSHMGRFQIYDWLYYRWEFWRIGAIALRARSPHGAAGPVPAFRPCGLSAAHLWPG